MAAKAQRTRDVRRGCRGGDRRPACRRRSTAVWPLRPPRPPLQNRHEAGRLHRSGPGLITAQFPGSCLTSAMC